LIGVDKILGIGDSSFLSQELLLALKHKYVCYLYQARAFSSSGFITDQWISSSDLGLSGNLALEWSSFCKDLVISGIHLQPIDDFLLWTGGDQSGMLTVKNVYNALTKKIWPHQIAGWRKPLLSWDLPYKIKLFTWLVVENKILTWENLQKRGWNGPSIFPLCSKDSELGLHLFVHCTFSQKLWQFITAAFNLSSSRGGSSISICFDTWLKQ